VGGEAEKEKSLSRVEYKAFQRSLEKLVIFLCHSTCSDDHFVVSEEVLILFFVKCQYCETDSGKGFFLLFMIQQ